VLVIDSAGTHVAGPGEVIANSGDLARDHLFANRSAFVVLRAEGETHVNKAVTGLTAEPGGFLWVDEYRLLPGKRSVGPSEIARSLRLHRHLQFGADLCSQRYRDVPPDTMATVTQVIIFGAVGETDRRLIRENWGRDTLRQVDDLKPYHYVRYNTHGGRGAVTCQPV